MGRHIWVFLGTALDPKLPPLFQSLVRHLAAVSECLLSWSTKGFLKTVYLPFNLLQNKEEYKQSVKYHTL